MSLDVTLRHNNEYVFDANITHNLGEMASRAGIYFHLWRPEEIDITTASQLIDPLYNGLCELLRHPKEYKKYESENGWGTYDGLLKFVQSYYLACVEYPEAIIEVDR